MRRFIVAACTAFVVAGGLAACGSSGNGNGNTPKASGGSAASCTKSSLSSQLKTPGKLTVATDNPVYPPWFVHNTPTNGKGYESAVAYAIAKQLGFSSSDVTWVTATVPTGDRAGPEGV